MQSLALLEEIDMIVLHSTSLLHAERARRTSMMSGSVNKAPGGDGIGWCWR